MDELFRFSVTRSADNTDAVSVSLESTSRFQTNPRVPGPPGLETIAERSPDMWGEFESTSIKYLASQLSFIDGLASSGIAKQRTAMLKKMRAIPESGWLEIVNAAAKPYVGKGLAKLQTFRERVADLFLALTIIRSGGPTHVHEIVQAMNIPPNAAEMLQFKPSLEDLAELLRFENLLELSIQSPESLKSARKITEALNASLCLPPKSFRSFAKPVRPVGFADLLVVKQHILRYELGEVARVENILRGETRDHTQKHTLSNQTTTESDSTQTTETDQGLTSTDHISLSNEIAKTMAETTKVDAGVHAQYTGVVNIQADLTVSYDRSSTESNKSASEMAKDVTQTAAKKVTDQVHQSSTRTVTEIFEELEEQKFQNIDKPNVSGVYQWVEKIYLAQVFNYGKRVLFDLMVPEPAASLIQADKVPLKARPLPPDPLGTVLTYMAPDPRAGQPVLDADGNKQVGVPLDFSQLTDAAGPNFYGHWVALFKVEGVRPPPPFQIVIARSKNYPYQDDQYITSSDVIPIDDGYQAVAAMVMLDWLTNDNPQANVVNAAGDNISVVDLTLSQGVRIHGEFAKKGPQNSRWPQMASHSQGVNLGPPIVGSVPYTVQTADVDSLTVSVELICQRTATATAAWQLDTFGKIAAAWQKLQDDYTTAIAAAKLDQVAVGILGDADPEVYRSREREELKRGCISILNNTPVHGSTDVVSAPLTLVDPNTAAANFQRDGAWVRWFEQAFDWENISYVFYPYYWGRSTEWLERLQRKNSDALFEAFLRAGHARVVIPVRPGFEKAVCFFLASGRPWMGGPLPHVGDKTYLPITEEIKELSGAPGNEKPVGTPWEIRLPTGLIKLRRDDKLPPDWKWTGHPSPLVPVGAWTWTGDSGG